MLQRFQGDDGRRLRVQAMLSQKMVAGNREIRLNTWLTMQSSSKSQRITC